MFVVLYAFAAAWIVISDVEQPDPLSLDLTPDGAGLVISGTVIDETSRDAIIDAVGTVTGATVIVAAIEIDPEARPIREPLETAAALAAGLPPDRN